MTSVPIQALPVHRRRFLAISLLSVTLLAGGAWSLARFLSAGAGTSSFRIFHTVVPMDLIINIKSTAELQAVNNLDIICQVEGITTIQQIVKEGTTVRKGDVILTLDSSEISRKLYEAQQNLRKAESDLIWSKEAQVIQEAQNVANLEGAQVELALAKLDLREYTEGKYPQQLKEAKKGVEMAGISLKNKDEELNQARKLFAKGFSTAADVKKAELDVLTAQNDFEKKSGDLNVLTEYTYEKDLTDKKNKLVQAERKLAKINTENSSNLAQKVADVSLKESILSAHKALVENLQKQVDYCTIKAPSDGLVIYGSSGRPYYYSDQQPIQAGTRVQQQQLLIRLPDTSAMKAVAKIPESSVPKLRMDEKNKMRATMQIVGQPAPTGGWVSSISVLADSAGRWMNPDLKEYPVEITLDQTPPGLKPGTTASVEIHVDRLQGVLCVPLSAIYSSGTKTYVFLREGARLQPQLVTLGAANETHAQITDGLQSGNEVLMLQMGQGRELLEKAGIQTGPTTLPSLADARMEPSSLGPQSQR